MASQQQQQQQLTTTEAATTKTDNNRSGNDDDADVDWDDRCDNDDATKNDDDGIFCRNKWQQFFVTHEETSFISCRAEAGLGSGLKAWTQFQARI